MLNPVEISDLKHRLDRISDQLTQTKNSLAATYPGFESELTAFFDRNTAIRRMMEDLPAKTAIAAAERATTILEQGFDTWLRSIDKSYAHPRPRGPTVSM